MKILEMSLLNTSLILVIIIIRVLALHKLPKKTFFMLWVVTLCRLLIPFSIPSRLSIYTVVNMLKNKFWKINVSPMSTVITDIQTTTNRTNATLVDTITTTVSPMIVIWMIGFLSCAIFFLVIHFRCRQEYKTSLPIDNEFVISCFYKHTLRRDVQIRQSDKIFSPLTYGVIRPVVLLPKTTDWTDRTRLCYILTHEFVHIKRFDTLTKLLLAFALCVHWFNPFVWLMYILANRDIELYCDETVVQILGEPMRSAYAMTLVDLEEKKSRLTALCSNFSKNSIEERIFAIMKKKKTSRVGTILALALVICTTIIFATNATADKKPTYESNVPLSSQEMAEWKQKVIEEMKKKYSVYSKYGLIYDEEKNRFYYKGELVRFFVHKLDEDSYNAFSFADGDIDLQVIQKEDLICLEPMSPKEYNSWTTNPVYFSGTTKKFVTFGTDNLDYIDCSYNAIKKPWTISDEEMKVGLYKGKSSHLFFSRESDVYFGKEANIYGDS